MSSFNKALLTFIKDLYFYSNASEIEIKHDGNTFSFWFHWYKEDWHCVRTVTEDEFTNLGDRFTDVLMEEINQFKKEKGIL